MSPPSHIHMILPRLRHRCVFLQSSSGTTILVSFAVSVFKAEMWNFWKGEAVQNCYKSRSTGDSVLCIRAFSHFFLRLSARHSFFMRLQSFFVAIGVLLSHKPLKKGCMALQKSRVAQLKVHRKAQFEAEAFKQYLCCQWLLINLPCHLIPYIDIHCVLYSFI